MYKRMFKEAERIEPPAGLWKRIAAGAKLRSAQAAAPADSRERPGFLRIAATLALAAGLLALGLSLRQKTGDRMAMALGTAAAETVAVNGNAAQGADEESVVDPDLMVWDADLGELEFEAEEAEEVL